MPSAADVAIMTTTSAAKSYATSTRRTNADRAIVATASDAIKSKLHAVSAGYYDDPFIEHFARGAEGLTAASVGSATATTALPVHLDGQTTVAAAAGISNDHQTNQHRQHAVVVRAHSSPPDSSSSAALSFYEDGDEDQQQFHHVAHSKPPTYQHHPLPHQFHQMRQQQQQQQQQRRHGQLLHNPHSNSHANTLAAMSPSDVHPALRGRLGIGISGSGPPSPMHPGLRRHISAGPGGPRPMPPPMNHTNIRSGHGQGQGGQPLIRRGTHARVCAMDRALTAFLFANIGTGVHQQKCNDTNCARTKRQVVVLGAGRDTSYLRYLDGKLISCGEKAHVGSSGRNTMGPKPQQEGKEMVRWFEVDFPRVIHQKMELLKTCPRVIIDDLQQDATGKMSHAMHIRLRSEGITSSSGSARSTTRRKKLVGITEEDMDVDLLDGQMVPPKLSSKRRGAILPYHLVGFDLRLPPLHLFEILQSEHGFDPNVPTIFLLECVLMYMPESSVVSLFHGISSACGSNAIVAIFDPILGDDGFGRIMEQHLTRAGVVAPPTVDSNDPLCLTAHRTIDSHLNSLISCGFNTAIGCDMLDAYDTAVIGDVQRARANSVELLDEIEEWSLIMRHYCFVVAGIATEAQNDLARYLCAAGDHSPLGFVRTKSVTREARQ